MLRLHLVRHGKTERTSKSGTDFDRQLIEKGIKQSRAVGKHLQVGHDVQVFCSSAARTRQTLEEIRSQADLPEAKYLKELYLCSTQDYLDLIWKIDGDSELLFIGHNFGISDLVSYLTDERTEMRTGEYIVIEFDLDSWKETSAGLGHITFRYRH